MKTTKVVNDDLFTLTDICNYYGMSESSIRRRVKASREGRGNFPLPLFGSGCRVLWRKSDVLSWSGEDAEATTFTAPPVSSFPKVTPSFPTVDQTRRTLESFGISLPPPTQMKPPPIS